MADVPPARPTHPTTFRLDVDLRVWFEARARLSRRGQSGLINEALRLLRRYEDEKDTTLFDAVVRGANGSGS